jgi:hypothetical protein
MRMRGAGTACPAGRSCEATMNIVPETGEAPLPLGEISSHPVRDSAPPADDLDNPGRRVRLPPTSLAFPEEGYRPGAAGAAFLASTGTSNDRLLGSLGSSTFG